jgi:hypothetical protein
LWRVNTRPTLWCVANGLTDEDAGFKPKNKKGVVVPEPQGEDNKKKQGYHDEANDSWEIGRNLRGKVNSDNALAVTSPFIELRNQELLKARHRTSDQPASRVVISVSGCMPAPDLVGPILSHSAGPQQVLRSQFKYPVAGTHLSRSRAG